MEKMKNYKYAQIFGTNMVYKLKGLSKIELSITKLDRPTYLTEEEFKLLPKDKIEFI